MIVSHRIRSGQIWCAPRSTPSPMRPRWYWSSGNHRAASEPSECGNSRPKPPRWFQSWNILWRDHIIFLVHIQPDPCMVLSTIEESLECASNRLRLPLVSSRRALPIFRRLTTSCLKLHWTSCNLMCEGGILWRQIWLSTTN
jgi:hypothetical protein